MFAQQKIIRGNTDLPDGARRTGRYTHNDKEIFVEDEPIYEERQRVDAAGDPIYRLNRAGEKISKLMEREITGFREREFVLDDLGNGVVTKNYDFAPEPGEMERIAARERLDPTDLEKRMARLEGMLAATLQATGLTVQDAAELVETQGQRQQAEGARAEREADIEARRTARRNETPAERAARLQERQERRLRRGPRQ